MMTSVQEESDLVDDETDEDEDNNNNESSKDPSNADAFSAMEWYEQQSECFLTQLLLLKTLQRENESVHCVRFHILHGSHSVIRTMAYPNCPVPVNSDTTFYCTAKMQPI
ncbi:hypothetical protein TNCV_1004571 [Trichonephila clavipes]|nr:hypothetical protein TNCV_1004571 [Trichonephila clavipes]